MLLAVNFWNEHHQGNIWQLNCGWGSGSDPASGMDYFTANSQMVAELRSVQQSSGAQTSSREYGYDRNNNLLTQYEWDWVSGTLTTPPSPATAAREMPPVQNITVVKSK